MKSINEKRQINKLANEMAKCLGDNVNVYTNNSVKDIEELIKRKNETRPK